MLVESDSLSLTFPFDLTLFGFGERVLFDASASNDEERGCVRDAAIGEEILRMSPDVLVRVKEKARTLPILSPHRNHSGEVNPYSIHVHPCLLCRFFTSIYYGILRIRYS